MTPCHTSATAFFQQPQTLSATAISLSWRASPVTNGAPLTGFVIDMAASSRGAAGGAARGGEGGSGAVGQWQHVLSTGPGDESTMVSPLRPGRTYVFRQVLWGGLLPAGCSLERELRLW